MFSDLRLSRLFLSFVAQDRSREQSLSLSPPTTDYFHALPIVGSKKII